MEPQGTGEVSGFSSYLVSRTMPSPPGWVLSCWCISHICAYVIYDLSLFFGLGQSPCLPYPLANSPYLGSAVAMGSHSLEYLPTVFSHVCTDLLHRGPLATSKPVLVTQEPRMAQESLTLGLPLPLHPVVISSLQGSFHIHLVQCQ